ncbi:DNA-3-methyladenine glycosylase [Neolewinella aurantiaca]|uniref:Putative 3-methyladenine DNA glycosylase n=1 Tax=Neolewinella aurantiaca TaxID=2602767 RepID=A0A5C7FPU9_9BACT|nr:DNA-3-methyladenine glycosylase [Neolewinella aurantiaca]TXF88469.1 DNA-3-methyladenine glycosylase [Neolewinella aurantiaca]
MDLTSLLAQSDPVAIARQLIGVELISEADGQETSVLLTEVEAYYAPHDLASHARNNTRTARTEVFWAAPGSCYIYTIHTHMMLNVVTGPVGTPHAILFRAGAPHRGLETIKARRKMTKLKRQLTTGPGVLAKALGIKDKTLYGSDLLDPENPLRLEVTTPPVTKDGIVATKRIGLGVKAGEWAEKPWRFHLKGSPFVTPG